MHQIGGQDSWDGHPSTMYLLFVNPVTIFPTAIRFWIAFNGSDSILLVVNLPYVYIPFFCFFFQSFSVPLNIPHQTSNPCDSPMATTVHHFFSCLGNLFSFIQILMIVWLP